MSAGSSTSDTTAPQLLLLGRPEWVGGAEPMLFLPERRFQLLALLALRAGEWVARDWIATLLWPERSNVQARSNLRHVVFKARELPAGAGLEANDHALRWDVATDLYRFDAALRARRPYDAIALRRGELLLGLDDASNCALTEWLEGERSRFQTRWHQAAIDALATLQAPQQRIELAHCLLQSDPLDEAALEASMRAELELGHVARAEQLFRDFAHRLAEELGVEPSRRLRDLLGRAPTHSIQPVREGADAPALPPARAPFIGRKSELAELSRQLAQAQTRLVTIVGPGGIGKSRLAQCAMQDAAACFAGGAHWVELQDLGDTASVLARLAQQLGVTLNAARDPVAQLGAVLGGQRVVCVLDNAEHLPDLPELVKRLLAAASALTLMVTSRVRLRQTNEWLLPLTGLPVPDEESRDIVAASAFDAVRLFEARAAAVLPSFSLSRDLAAVIDIVESVEGMPLAIELAAGWVRLLPVREIARDLRQTVDLLERNPALADVPARPQHDSLRAVLDGSWKLLAPRERDTLAALSVFQGGFTRAAALAVARSPLPVLSSLIDKSLLGVDDAGRFAMHPLVAAFAAERLALDGGRATELAQQHAAYYAHAMAALATRAGADHRPLVEGIESDYANYRAAWRFSLARGATEWLALSCGAWRTYFEVRGRAGEGITHFQPAVDLSAQGRQRQSLAADARSALSRMHYLRGDHQSGLAIAQSGAELAEQCNDRRALYRCLTNAGSCHSAQAQWGAARPYFERALAIGRDDGMAMEIAAALNNLGIIAKNEGRWDEALEHYTQALAIEREHERHAAVVRCLSTLGGMHLSRGDWPAARQCMEEGLRLSERFRIDFFVPVHACGLGEALLEMGELDDAQRHLLRALERARSADIPMIVVNARANLGRVATLRGEREAAIEHLRDAARGASERGWSNMCLHVAMLYGEWLRAAGRGLEAAQVWQLVSSDPKADAGMRERARRWCDALSADLSPSVLAQSGAVTLSAIMDRLLGSDPTVDDPSCAPGP